MRVFHKPKVSDMLAMKRPRIRRSIRAERYWTHETLVFACSDDGAALLRAVPAFLRPRNGPSVVLFSARLMRQGANKDAEAPAGPDAENCPHCKNKLSDAWIKAAHSRVAGRQGGRPRLLRPCPFCKVKFGGRELREHIPRCGEAAKSTASKSRSDSTDKSAATRRVPTRAQKRRSTE